MLLFVYGSLRRAQPNHELLARARFLGEARTALSYDLCKVDGFLAMIAGERGVSGELYEVDPELLARLDEFEGQAYARRVIELSDGQRPFAYVLAADPSD